ncbi:MAG: hypothetical protein WC130_05030 [Kiritimatiellia bacterium]
MFEKPNEVDEKLGDFGTVKVDITPALKVNANVEVGMPKKDLIPAVPGALVVKVSAVVDVDSDPLALAAYGLGKVDNPIVKFLAKGLADFRAGQEMHPAITAAIAAEQSGEQKA